jgi:hypothetical protein
MSDNLSFSADDITFNYDASTNSIKFYDTNSALNALEIGNGISVRSPNGAISGIYFPVWTSNPSGSAQAISSRTAVQLKGDIGLGNVENTSLSSVTFTAGSGLSGGGNLSSDRTFNVGAGEGISVGADTVSVDSTVVRTSGSQTISGIKTFTNTIVFQSGLTSSGTLSAQSAASTGPNSFAVFDSSPTGSSVALSSRTLTNVRTDLGASGNTASTLVLRDSSGNFSASTITVTGLITESVSGSLPNGIYKSSSISGINNTTYLHNFIIDGGTP